MPKQKKADQPRKMSDMMKEMSERLLRDPEAAHSSEAFHVALFFANLAWNECVGLGAERERTKNIWQSIEAENPKLWDELKSRDIDAMIDELVEYKKAHFPDDQRRILLRWHPSQHDSRGMAAARCPRRGCKMGNATLRDGACRDGGRGRPLPAKDPECLGCGGQDDGGEDCQGFGDGLTGMDFHTYTTMRDWTRRVDPDDRPAQDIDQFYRRATADAQKMGSGQFFGQMLNERDWEKARRPYYNMWPSHHPDADPAEPRPGFRSDPVAASCPVHPFPEGPGQEPAQVRVEGEGISRPLHHAGGDQRGDWPFGAGGHWGGHGRRRRADLHLSQFPPQAGPDRGAVHRGPG